MSMITKLGCAMAMAATLAVSAPPARADDTAHGDGIVRVRSGYTMGETVTRLKNDVAAKGIMFFTEIDQARLAANTGINLRPSTLLVFGNPPLGTQFITANPTAGLDWPVRLLVSEDETGTVWASYSDFEWIKQRHHIKDRDAAFKMASEVIASITSTVK